MSTEEKIEIKPSYSFGRKVLYSSYTQKELTDEKIKEIINKVFPIHLANRSQMEYLEKIYRGEQPILYKTKTVRENINNIVIENYAFFMTEFKKGYIFGKPLKYVQIGETTNDEISILNKYMTKIEKHSKDTMLAESLYVNGIGHLIILPNKDEDSSVPFNIDVLDSKKTFIVYESGIGNKPLLGVTYFPLKKDGRWYYKGSIYTNNYYYDFEFSNSSVEKLIGKKPHILGKVPIIEYRLNKSRLGIIEITLSMQHALNKIASSDLDGIEQFIQSLVVFVNNDVDAESFKELMELGAVKIKSSSNLPADVKLLVNDLDHSNTDIYYQRVLSNMLNIVGIPIPSTKTSGGDTGEARELGDGWTMADLRADQDELMFKTSELNMLKLALKICKTDPKCEIKELESEEIEIQFERNKANNLLVKTQSLQNLRASQVAPKSALSVVGLWSDPNAVAEESKAFYGEDWWKDSKKEEDRQSGITRQNSKFGNYNQTNEENIENVSNKTKKTDSTKLQKGF